MLSRLQENLLRLNRKLQVGDELIYSDSHNYAEFEVIEINKNLFLTVDNETGEIEERDLHCIQYGWDFKSSYLKKIELQVK